MMAIAGVATIMEVRRALGSVACERISSWVVFVVPPYPPVEPRGYKSKLFLFGVASGISFLAIQKIIKKWTPQKRYFWSTFGDFWIFVF